MVYRRPPSTVEIERLARALCGQNDNAALLEQARVVATNELVLREINMQKIAAVERLREPTAIALAKGDNSLTLAKARFMQAWLAHREIEALVPKVLEKCQSQAASPLEMDRQIEAPDIVPWCIMALLGDEGTVEQQPLPLELARKHLEHQGRDEHEALEEAAADLVRLDRYERRAWLRQKRAIGSFMNPQPTAN
jgi:hypothetical protein